MSKFRTYYMVDEARLPELKRAKLVSVRLRSAPRGFMRSFYQQHAYPACYQVRSRRGSVV